MLIPPPLEDFHETRLAMPLPLTFELAGTLRRQIPVERAGVLFSIFDEFVCRTVLHDPCEIDGTLSKHVERWIRVYSRLRREWIDLAYDLLGDAGLTPLRVEALAVARNVARRWRVPVATRTDLEAAFDAVSPAFSAFAIAVRTGAPIDCRRLRVLSTRFDACVAAALLAEADPVLPAASAACPILCSEARIAATEIRRLVVAPGPAPASGPRGRRTRTVAALGAPRPP